MSHILELSDDTYEALRELASVEGKTPESLISSWAAQQIEALHRPAHNPYTEPRYYTTDEWFRHLGMTDEEMAEVDNMVDDDEDEVGIDADA